MSDRLCFDPTNPAEWGQLVDAVAVKIYERTPIADLHACRVLACDCLASAFDIDPKDAIRRYRIWEEEEAAP